jgi:type IX secretion system PorP/SprF family membrane protein
MMKKILLMGFIVLTAVVLKGQDPQLSQFYASPLYQSPSYTGITGDTRLVFNYRDQWPNLPGHFTTYAFSLDNYFARYNSGLGVMFLKDQEGQGKLSTTNVGLYYSYKIKLGEKYYLQPGLSGYYFSRSIDPSLLTFADQYLGSQILPESVTSVYDQRYQHWDFGTSMLLYNESLWIGGTVDHLMKLGKPLTENYQYIPVKFVAFGGGKIILNQRLQKKMETSLTLAFNFKSQGLVQQGDLGMYIYKIPLFVGLWYRGLPGISSKSQDAISMLIGYKGDSFSVGYNYDFTISKLITRTGGAHEVAIIYNFNTSNLARKKMGSVPCPVF